MLRRVLAIVFAAVVIAPALAQNKSGGGILVIPPTYPQRGHSWFACRSGAVAVSL